MVGMSDIRMGTGLTYTRVKTVKSVATAVSTRRTAPNTIPLLLKANGSERTPPPAHEVTRRVLLFNRESQKRANDERGSVVGSFDRKHYQLSYP